MIGRSIGSDRRRLREIPITAGAAEIEWLGAVVAQLRDGQRRVQAAAVSVHGAETALSDLFLVATTLLEQQRQRRAAFPDLPPGEIGWDIVLHLYVAENAATRTAVAELARALDQPFSTASRWIAVLEASGQLLRERDRTDRRRSFVCLAPALRQRIEAYLDAIR